MTMYKYRIRLHHDNGNTTATVNATDDDMMYNMVQALELCPKRSIKILSKKELKI